MDSKARIVSDGYLKKLNLAFKYLYSLHKGDAPYPLSYRQVTEMVNERGYDIDYTTVFRWVQEYSPELDKRS